jgi:hypothetical protein
MDKGQLNTFRTELASTIVFIQIITFTQHDSQLYNAILGVFGLDAALEEPRKERIAFLGLIGNNSRTNKIISYAASIMRLCLISQ